MKTISDLAAHMKRNQSAVSMKYLEKEKAYLVVSGDDAAQSSYLDDALENLQEAARRRANGMKEVREVPAPPAPPPPPKINTTSLLCSKCNTGVGLTMSFWSGNCAQFACGCGVCVYYVFRVGERVSTGNNTYEFNGTAIGPVSP